MGNKYIKEEKNRLTYNYIGLMKKYPCEKMYKVEDIQYPIIDFKVCPKGFKLNILDNPDTFYKLPEFIKEKFDELISLYSQSTIYNSITIRLKNYEVIDNILTLQTERTTYFNSLVTNRAIDYKFTNGTTLRDYLEPSPVISKLNNSLLSNHIGIDCVLITKDNSIIFIKRGNENSIAKGLLALGCTASLKYKDVITDKYIKYDTQILHAVKEEISDELGIISKNPKPVAIYRKLQEGGKPQIVFFEKLPYTDKEIAEIFKEKTRTYKTKDMSMDGNEIIFLNREDCQNQNSLDTLVFHKITYKTTPETLAILHLTKDC